MRTKSRAAARDSAKYKYDFFCSNLEGVFISCQKCLDNKQRNLVQCFVQYSLSKLNFDVSSGYGLSLQNQSEIVVSMGLVTTDVGIIDKEFFSNQ